MLTNLFGSSRQRLSHNADAVVTGAGSGIGRAFAIELAKRGGRIVCVDINAARAAETADAIGSAAEPFTCDVANRSDMESLALHAELSFGGPPTLVINNAGVGIGGRRIGSIGLDDWEWALGINLMGVVYGCELFVPQLRAAGRGGVINVASSAGFAAAPGMGAYNVSKAAVMSLSETLAAELAGSGVNVSVLCPTFVKTNVARDGRITGPASEVADRLMRWTGYSAKSVVRTTLDAHDKGQLYVLPQLDAHLIWHLKRHFPTQYASALGVLNRFLPESEPTLETTEV